MAKFFSYRTTHISPRRETPREEYHFDTSYHIIFRCDSGGMSSDTRISRREDFIREVISARARGFVYAGELPREVPTMKRFKKPKTVEGSTLTSKVVLNTLEIPSNKEQYNYILSQASAGNNRNK